MRIIGMDIHRSFAQVAFLVDGQVTKEARVDLPHDRFLRSCPEAWCRTWVAYQVLRPVWPDGQAATAGRLTMGSSPSGAMVSSVMYRAR